MLVCPQTQPGIATQVDGFLGVGVTGYNLNVTGVITANSFSGDGSGLTGIAATDDVEHQWFSCSRYFYS